MVHGGGALEVVHWRWCIGGGALEVVHGGAWWCMVVHGVAWWCMVVHGGAWCVVEFS